MYIEKIKINKFRVLEDIEVVFQPPGGPTADPVTGNVVNVIAGVNGTGKTSLLKAIWRYAELASKDVGVNVVVDKELTLRDDGMHDLLESRSAYLQGLSEVNRTPHIINISAKKSGQKNPIQVSDLLKMVAAFGLPLGNDPINTEDVESSSKLLDSVLVSVGFEKILEFLEKFIKEFIISRERRISKPTYDERLSVAVKEFDCIFDGISILSRLADLEENTNRPRFKSATGSLLYADDLSDGEKELYAKIAKLFSLNPHNSVILIDEPEIALHPAWQQKIMQIYSRIGKNNQFIVATHSPQVIRSVPYRNRIILTKQDEGKIQPVYYYQPPSGVDINSILSEVMGADPVPSAVLALYSQYRALVEAGQEATPKAIEIKAQLLLEEGENSSFMQEMSFLIDLRDAV